MKIPKAAHTQPNKRDTTVHIIKLKISTWKPDIILGNKLVLKICQNFSACHLAFVMQSNSDECHLLNPFDQQNEENKAIHLGLQLPNFCA